MNVTFRQLRVFTEVAKHGSMARAAEALHLTPPAVSMQIKEVESQVGLPLFDRNGRAVSLSTAGEYFLVHARRLLVALKDADDAMARFRKLESGSVNVGLISTAQYFVPRLLTRFREEHPGVELRLRVGANRDELVTLLQRGEVDLAVMGRPPKELATRAEPFAAHPHVFVANPGHPILALGRPPVSALVDWPLIVREPASGTRALLDRLLLDYRVQPRIAMEMPSNETIKQAVMAGMGLGFLSLHTLELELRAGLIEIVQLETAPIVRMWNIVHVHSKMLSPAAEALRYFILEHGGADLAELDRQWLPQLAAPSATESSARLRGVAR
jgi:LysR family transcriptional regulator, low CO2-responsive transcriptional regulator